MGSIVGGVVGAITGAKGKKQTTTSSERLILDDPSALENLASSGMEIDFSAIRSLLNLGPGETDVSKAVAAQRDLATALQEQIQTGGLPSAADVGAARQAVSPLFESQKADFDKFIRERSIESDRLSARLGRPVNDPVLQSKLNQTLSDQFAAINAAESGAAQQLAFQLPGQRIALQSQAASVLGGLGNQALQNRATVLGLGSQLQAQERNFRVQSAQRTGTNTTSTPGGFAQGLAGGLTGALAGFQTDASLFMGNPLGMMGGMGRAQQSQAQPYIGSVPSSGFNLGSYQMPVSNANPFANSPFTRTRGF